MNPTGELVSFLISSQNLRIINYFRFNINTDVVIFRLPITISISLIIMKPGTV